MIVKELLGEILTKKGFLTRQQLKKALERQKEIFEQNALPERLDRASLVSEARVAADVDKTPLLGKILVDMQLTTTEQVEEGLKEQEKHVEIYKSLDSKRCLLLPVFTSLQGPSKFSCNNTNIWINFM